MSKPLGIAVVGLGLAGSVMTEAIKRHPGVRLAAGVEPYEPVRERFRTSEGLPAYGCLDEALADPHVDVAYLATPPTLHRDQALAALARGRHVLVEKPMAPTAAACDEMVSAAASAGRALVVGHTHGFDPGVALIAELVRSGRYGAPGLLALRDYTNFLYRPRSPEEFDASAGGGVVFNQVAHQVEMARTILDRPVRAVRAFTTRLDPTRPGDGSCTALLDFGDGVAANLLYAGYDHFDSDELHGWVTESGHAGQPRHGSARSALRQLDDAEHATQRRRSLSYGARALAEPTHQPHFGELVLTCAGADLRLGIDAVVAYTDSGPVQHPLPTGGGWSGHAAVLDELLAAVAGNEVRHDGVFGAATVRVCEAIVESAAVGAEVLVRTAGQ